MKSVLAYIMLILFFTHCTSNENNLYGDGDLISKWKLIEIYSDPGDGSGDFNPVESDKTVSFYSNNVIYSSGNLCVLSSSTTDGSYGTYSSENNTISPESCPVELPYGMTYMIENNMLTINYPCIEGCAEKYQLITTDLF